jgi:putative ABC transport system permease protein
MKGHDLLELARRNLRESLLRNSLTTLGIAVGVASLVAMLSLGVGLQNLASRRLERSGLFDTVVAYSGRTFGPFTPREQRNTAGESRILDDGARKEMARLPNVVEVYPEIRFSTEVRYNERLHYVTVAGLPPSARENDAFEGMQGRFFSGPQAEEVILQSAFARELADQPQTLLGREVILRYAERRAAPARRPEAASAGHTFGALGLPAQAGRRAEPRAGSYGAEATSPRSAEPEQMEGADLGGFSVLRRERKLRVVGIIEPEPGGAFRGPVRARVFIPLQLAENLNAAQPVNLLDALRSSATTSTYQALVVRVSGPANVRAAQDAIRRMGFSAYSLLDATQNLRRFFAVLDLFLGMFGSLALAVASLGIINTFLMAILERRREIGIMKALGASDRDVKGLFLAEAGAMGVVGGVVGVGLGWAIGRMINFGANIYLRRQELPPERIWSVPWWLVAGAVGFAVLLSLVSSLYPAARAAKLDPVQALRYE